jgi:hypothetical protein
MEEIIVEKRKYFLLKAFSTKGLIGFIKITNLIMAVCNN